MSPSKPAAILLSDLSACTPKARLTRRFEDGRWQLTDYETVDGVSGLMVTAFPDHDSGTLTLPLDLKGPFRIFLGINYTKPQHVDWSPYGELAVKLDGDFGYSRVGAENMRQHAGHLPPKMGIVNEIYKSIQEAYWKTADLTGRSIHFRQPGPPYNGPEWLGFSNLAYVRLVPLNDGEIESWKREAPTAGTRCLAQLFCTGQLTGHTAGTRTYHPTSEEWFREEITPLIDSDFGILVFEALRGSYASYRTKIGYLGTEADQWEDDWVDPLEVLTRLSHENGLRIFASLRMISVQYPMNRAPIARAKHFHQMPQFAKQDRNGRPLTGLSLAYPEVRTYWLSLLRETLEYGTDGIQLHLNRANPFVLYEEPVVDSFREKHGIDPRELPEDDPRYLAHQAGYVTQFVREVRLLLNERPNRELAVTFYGEPHKYDRDDNPYHPIRYGCAVEDWIREGLVDYLMPSPKISPEFIRQWRELGGDRLHIWPDLMPRTQPAEMYARLAGKYYEAGADGFCLWDGERRPQRVSEWAAVRRLGHRDQLDRLMAEAPGWYRKVDLAMLGGFSARESFHDG